MPFRGVASGQACACEGASGMDFRTRAIFVKSDLQRQKPNRFRCVYVMALQDAEKLKVMSFRGALGAEESLILLTLNPGEIPRFARNDGKKEFFRNLFSPAPQIF